MLSACSSLQLQNYIERPKVSYKSIDVSKISADGIVLNPTFNVDNSNGFPVPINSVNYTLLLNEQTVLAGETNEIGTLPANDNKDISLSLDLTKDTLMTLQKLLSQNKQLDYQIKGDVNAMGLSVPFEKSATLYMPEIKIVDFKVTNANFNQFDMLLSVDIDNQNDFSLPLENISYSVSSNNQSLFEGNVENKELGKGKNNIQLPLTIRPSDMFNNIFSLLLNPNTPLHVEIESPLFSKSYDHNLNIGTYFK